MNLTPRQREVARLVAAGLSNKAIAHTLHISEHTAVRHVQNVYERLGIRSRVELVLYFLKRKREF
jgi:DNA-binding NarL/FixJ family response regulator